MFTIHLYKYILIYEKIIEKNVLFSGAIGVQTQHLPLFLYVLFTSSLHDTHIDGAKRYTHYKLHNFSKFN